MALIASHLYCLSTGNPSDVKPVGQGYIRTTDDYASGYRVHFIQHGETFSAFKLYPLLNP